MTTANPDGRDRLRFPRGQGRYVADLFGADALHVAFVRSTVARGKIEQVDFKAALSSPGVVAVVGADEAADELQALTLRYGPGKTYPWDVFPAEWVSYAGEPLAAVVATSRAAAEQAAEVVDVQIEPAEPVLSPRDALSASSPGVRPETGTNLAFTLERGAADVTAALAGSALVLTKSFHAGRKSPFPLEPRGVLAWTEPTSRQLVVATSTQVPYIARKAIARALHRAEHTVRIITPDVGGGFGLKAQVYAEEIIVGWLATRLQCRVGWIEDRWENLVAAYHAHDEWLDITAGFAADGTLRAVDVQAVCDIGAHSNYPLSSALIPSTVAGHVFGPYRVPEMRTVAQAVYTNKPPAGAYRGVGAPTATFAAERMLDIAADELGLDHVEIRRRNLIRGADLPYAHPSGSVYSDIEPLALYHRLLAAVGERDLRLESLRRPAAGDGPVTGIGMAVYNEHSGPGSKAYRARGTDEVPGFDSTRIELTADGRLVVYLSSADAGQDHATTCRMEIARVLRVDPAQIDVIEGDTQVCPPGTGTFASRFAPAQLASALTAAQAMDGRIQGLAAELLGSSPDRLHPAEGGGYYSGSDSAGINIAEIARRAYLGEGAAAGGLPIATTGYWDAHSALPWGAILAVVELDPHVFAVKVKNVVMVENCGRIINRDGVLEQLRGGIVMGMGDALYEEHHFSPSGELVTASLLDYLVPLADSAPEVAIELVEDVNADDVKVPGRGIGEAGCIGAFAAVGCAVADAIKQLGGRELNELPASPVRIFDTLA